MASKNNTSIQQKSVYVISGKDSFLVNNQLNELIDSLLEPCEKQDSLFVVDPQEISVAELLDDLRTAGLFSAKKVLLIKQADAFISGNRSTLEKYFEKPSSDAVVIFTVKTFASNTRLAKKISSVGNHFKVEDIKTYKLPDFASRYAVKKYNKNLNKSASAVLVELAGDDPGHIASEIDKLAVYVADRKTISYDDVVKLTGNDRVYDAFSVIDALTSGNYAGAIQRLRNMFSADKSTEFSVVGAFAYHIRRLFSARAMLDNGLSRDHVKRKLGLWKNPDAFLRQINKLSLEQIAQMLAGLGSTDFMLKTSQTTAANAMERFIYDFASKLGSLKSKGRPQ